MRATVFLIINFSSLFAAAGSHPVISREGLHLQKALYSCDIAESRPDFWLMPGENEGERLLVTQGKIFRIRNLRVFEGRVHIVIPPSRSGIDGWLSLSFEESGKPVTFEKLSASPMSAEYRAFVKNWQKAQSLLRVLEDSGIAVDPDFRNSASTFLIDRTNRLTKSTQLPEGFANLKEVLAAYDEIMPTLRQQQYQFRQYTHGCYSQKTPCRNLSQRVSRFEEVLNARTRAKWQTFYSSQLNERESIYGYFSASTCQQNQRMQSRGSEDWVEMVSGSGQ